MICRSRHLWCLFEYIRELNSPFRKWKKKMPNDWKCVFVGQRRRLSKLPNKKQRWKKKTLKTNQETLERTQIFVIYNTWAGSQQSADMENNNDDIRRIKGRKNESKTASFWAGNGKRRTIKKFPYQKRISRSIRRKRSTFLGLLLIPISVTHYM